MSEVDAMSATTPGFIRGDFNADHEVIDSTGRKSNAYRLADVTASVPKTVFINTDGLTHIA